MIWSLVTGPVYVSSVVGAVTNTSGAIHVYDVGYPGVFFNTGIADINKIQYVIDNLHDKTFTLEPFSYISLPNDHTVGTSPGMPTPQSMVADNDEATGRFVDALSHSNYWASSIVFVIEDNPQDGGDHVELHRSPGVVISPWIKRGYTSSVHYDVPAMWHTMTMLLGVDPINQRDGNAPAMFDLFSTKPDLEPYTFIPRGNCQRREPGRRAAGRGVEAHRLLAAGHGAARAHLVEGDARQGCRAAMGQAAGHEVRGRRRRRLAHV